MHTRVTSLLVALAALVVFIAVAAYIPEEGASPLDEWAGGLFAADAQSGPNSFFYFVYKLGSTPVFGTLTVVVAVVLWLMRLRREAFAVIGTVLLAWLSNSLLKNTIERLRPDHPQWIDAAGYSFPSAHAMVGTALVGIMAYLISRAAVSIWTRTAAIAVAAVIIALNGYSRIYFGVHYMTDVIAGFACGVICLCCAALWLGGEASGTSSRSRGRSRATFPGNVRI